MAAEPDMPAPDRVAEGWSQPADELPNEPAATPQQPAGTSIKIERFEDGVTIEIPPAGLWKGTHGLFPVAVLLNGFMAVFTLGLLGLLLAGKPLPQGGDAVWVLPLLLAIFWIAGICLLLAALNMGRRRAALAVTGGSLMVLQTGLFGGKRRSWGPGEVEAIRVGPSGLEVNEVPVQELQIYGGGKFSLLAGRTDAELEWVAAELRGALKRP